LNGKVGAPGLEKPRLWLWGSGVLTTRHPLSAKVGTNFADRLQSLGQYIKHTVVPNVALSNAGFQQIQIVFSNASAHALICEKN
jgi:hypothetical protein